MTRKLIDDINLTMRRGLKLELVSYTEHSCFLLGFYENIDVVIGGFKIRYSIFVFEVGDHNLVLGKVFLNSLKFSQKYKPEEIFDIITHLHMHQTAVFRILAP